MNEPSFVSIVIPTHNRVEVLEACLQSLLAQDYPSHLYEVIVVDAASADRTLDRVRAAAARVTPAIRGLAASTRDANSARNLGIRSARAELIALIDDDVIAPPGWIGAVAAGAARNPGAECLGGPVRPVFEHKAPRTCTEHRFPGAALDKGAVEKEVADVWGCNMAFRRTALERVGRFREGLRLQQEWEWQQRLLAHGGRIVYLPDAWLWHRRLASDLRLGSLMGQYLVRGYRQGLVGQAIPSPVLATHSAASLVHWLRSRCTYGLIQSARECGLFCGELVRAGRGLGRSLGGISSRTRAPRA